MRTCDRCGAEVHPLADLPLAGPDHLVLVTGPMTFDHAPLEEGNAIQVVFIVDLNEIENGSEVPISMDYTLNYGPRVLMSPLPRLYKGHWVRVHSDDDNDLYYARVEKRLSDRDYIVKIDWSTGAPVLNQAEWSARTCPVVDTESGTLSARAANAS